MTSSRPAWYRRLLLGCRPRGGSRRVAQRAPCPSSTQSGLVAFWLWSDPDDTTREGFGIVIRVQVFVEDGGVPTGSGVLLSDLE